MRTPLKRARFVAIATAASALPFGRPAQAAEFTYKVGTDVPPSHPVTAQAIVAADAITRASGGRLEVRVFPNSQLGSTSDMLGQARQGALEFGLIGDNVIADVQAAYQITSVPFSFRNYKDVWAVSDGSLGKILRSNLGQIGLYGMERPWDNGFRQISNRVKPLNTPDDLKGMKFRVPASPMHVALYKALNAIPISLNGGEQYQALQTHLVDGVDLPLAAMESFKLSEVEKFCAMTNQLWTGVTLVASLDQWRKLPSNLRDLCEKTFNDNALLERAAIARGDADLMKKLKAAGMAFTQPDTAPFRDILKKQGLYGQWRDRIGPAIWAQFEHVVGPLAT